MSTVSTIADLAKDVERIVAQCSQEGLVFNSYKAEQIVKGYSGDDWKQFVKFDPERYNRIRVYYGESFDIWLICWGIGQGSSVHDHPKNGCIQKVLQGELEETRYIKKRDDRYCKWKRRIYTEGGVGYISGKSGVHMLKNIGDVDAVTLHLYSPPNYIPKIITV